MKSTTLGIQTRFRGLNPFSGGTWTLRVALCDIFCCFVALSRMSFCDIYDCF